MRLSDFDYALPPHLIARRPLPSRSASRLLHVRGAEVADRRFRDLPALARPGDLLVVNDTRVVHARLRGTKPSGGRVEVMVERITGEHELDAQLRASHKPRPGTRLALDGGLEVEVLAREGEFFRLRFPGNENVMDLLERHGSLPLPPYLGREAEESDETRYQTVYARSRGSVAAPTAGLHFDRELLAAISARGIGIAHLTLEVGAGTFQPVRVEELAQHRMHRERYHVPEATVQAVAAARASGGRVIAVGTTSLRALEAAAAGGSLRAGPGETDLFILPGYRFRIPDCLVTNFHLPRTTLLMLACAFGGTRNVLRAYAHAIEHGYRFYSYGDAMFIEREAQG
ncbi:MAG: tRNA preQ1(34) S-adenosylmethionine ribosyltransferase-isomerase QueA [Rhodocyclaceae bacterium]